jgi:tetratricopeptide (TPR) repeat protein
VEQIRKMGNNEAIWTIIPNWFVIGATPHRFRERIILAQEMLKQSRDGIKLELIATSISTVGNVFLEYEQRDRCQVLWDEYREMAERSGNKQQILVSMMHQAVLKTMDGKLDEAITLTDNLLIKGEEFGFQAVAKNNWLTIGMRVRFLMGKIEGLLESLPPPPAFLYYRILLLASQNEQDRAKDILDQMLENRPNLGKEDDYIPYYVNLVYLEAAVLANHHRAAEVLLRQLAGKTPNIAGITYNTCVPRHFGAAAKMLGRPDEAYQYYREALKAASNVRFRPEIALTRFQLAELLFEHYFDEKDTAREHLNFAIDEFKDMKMQPSLEKAQALKNKV